MFKLTNIALRHTKTQPVFQNILRFSSSTAATEPKQTFASENKAKVIRPIQPRNSMVAAAFAALQDDSATHEIQTPRTDERVLNAKSVNELFSISEGSGISRKHALKVLSVLTDWCSSGKAQLSDFESDPRFIRLCKVLTKPLYTNKYSKVTYQSRSEDLSTVLDVKADDEAAKLIGSITLPQMVKVLSTLSIKKRRSTSLLRALAYNITASSEKLNLKHCADVLFSLATLNFYDSNLLEKVCIDVCFGISSDIKKSSVIGSILTSVGLLKYKDIGVLDTLSEWMLKHIEICRPQDLFALVQTLAVLNHYPSNGEQLFPVLLQHLTYSEANGPSVWLDNVWSLVLLNMATKEHVSTVLSEAFVQQLLDCKEANPIASKLKLLNIDAYARLLLKNYTGPCLSDELRRFEVPRQKSKEEISASLLDTLKNLMNAETCLNINVNTEMGFLIDAECFLDKKGNVIPLDKSSKDSTRVAIIIYDYYDMCRGRTEPTGINVFASRLLQVNNYKILTIPYVEFRPRDKLIRRVQYIETKLKQLAQC